jgi:hypothetical protein
LKQKPSKEFEAFDRVMSGLLAVPYSELQKKLQEENRNKAQQKKKRPVKTASRVATSGKKRAA